MVKLRGGDGVEFSVQARRLAERAPRHVWDLPAIESGDIYDTVQLYRRNAERFTSRATGGLLPQGVLNVQTIFAQRVNDLDTLGHLTRVSAPRSSPSPLLSSPLRQWRHLAIIRDVFRTVWFALRFCVHFVFNPLLSFSR